MPADEVLIVVNSLHAKGAVAVLAGSHRHQTVAITRTGRLAVEESQRA
jgi:hypothetical protein